jgi:hypothetical protein
MKNTDRKKYILAYLFLILNGAFINNVTGTTSAIYDKFRLLFGNVSMLQTYDIDQITSQILNQVNCTSVLGADCFNVSYFCFKCCYFISQNINLHIKLVFE